jgi:hypothetical protein
VRPREGGGVDMEPPADTQTMAALDAFMWVLIFGLLVAIVVGYLI